MMPKLTSTLAGFAALLTAYPPTRLAAQSLRVPYTTFTLPNGLQVILHEDHSVPVVAVNTWYHVGSADERPGRTGFAHLFEHIMFMGSQHVPTGEFDRLLEAAGADNNASTTEDVRGFFRTYYAPHNATLAIAGDITPRDARRLAERYFGDITGAPAPTRAPPPPVTLAADVHAVLEDRVQVPRVYDAWHTM